MRLSPSGLYDRDALLLKVASREHVSNQPSLPSLIQSEGLHLHTGCSSACADGAPCDCSHSQAWCAPRQPRPRRRSRAGRVLRDLVRWLLSPRAW